MSIIPTKTQLPAVELIYLEDIDAAGIHIRGLASLLGCHPQTVQDQLKGVKPGDQLEAQVETVGGVQGVNFVLEQGVIQLLKSIRRNTRIKPETREAAEGLYDRFAVAGFKLYTMLQVAPEVLKAKVDRHLEEVELEKLRGENLRLEKDLVQFKHYVVTALPEPQQQKILGYERVVEIEYRDRVIQGDDVIDDGSTLNKTALCHRLGFLTGKGKPDFKRLNQYLDRLPSEAFRLSIRPVENREVYREWLPELEELIERSERQRWLGE